ncbi:MULTISPECIES: hypothetical protein [Streptomyces violaceusniger group]|uniref:hypothetical protein n=1 Tax=Streptomyces violaceusniger group TaxID=2839105 RepID=UPI000A3C21EC|nr:MULTISPECIES: hypothetical protein [Streptomyces violaceusniger group]
MAERFVCDPQEADLVARELSRTGSDIQLSVPHPLDGAMSGVASVPIAETLGEFFNAVTETRIRLIESVGTVAGLFAALSEGAVDLDQAFADRAMEM